ncbi:hypothetical protein HY345_02010 [Candidatus Microgenomates bacterium]|nr:hypothetical protein [Candidatus Microgenomates bacterium]
MNNNKIILASLASDLKRVTLGLQRKSYVMVDKFTAEALKRKSEINSRELESYMQNLLAKLEEKLSTADYEKKAEDTLLYSTLIQNYVLYK